MYFVELVAFVHTVALTGSLFLMIFAAAPVEDFTLPVMIDRYFVPFGHAPIVFWVVMVALAYALYAFRAKPGDESDGEPIQRIRYADNETDYCVRCQTGGKLLADRSLSRLLRSDWPKTLDELETLKRR